MRSSQYPINQKLDSILAEARAIRLAMIHGALPYDEAKNRVEPLLDQVNRVGKAIAKKYGRRYKQIKFTDI